MAHAADVPDRLLTLAEYEQLPEDDGYRDEVVRGRLVREPVPADEHGWLQVRLAFFLYQHVEREGLGLVLAESGVVLAEEPLTVRSPDLSFVARERVGGYPARRLRRVAPDLAVEIVSPANRASELQEKVMDYLDGGTRLVWVVDPRSRSVTVYRSRAEIRVLREEEELDGGDVVPGFRLPLARLFAFP